MKTIASFALFIAVSTLSHTAHCSPSQHLELVRTATLYTITSHGLPSERPASFLAFMALKGTLTRDTIKNATVGATAAGQLYLAALACHAGDRRAGEAMIAKLDERTAVLSTASGNLVYRNVKTLAEPGSPQNPCPIAPIPAGE